MKHQTILGEDDLESGHVVQLISGGLPMTVKYAINDRAADATGKAMGVYCDWLDNEGRPHQGVFTRQQLIRLRGVEAASKQAETPG